jgi:hypothetical protein
LHFVIDVPHLGMIEVLTPKKDRGTVKDVQACHGRILLRIADERFDAWVSVESAKLN